MFVCFLGMRGRSRLRLNWCNGDLHVLRVARMNLSTVSFSTYAEAIASGSAMPPTLLDTFGANPTPYEALRATVSREDLRRKGTFFTSSTMARRLWAMSISSVGTDSVVVDPACGAGDLLLPVLERSSALGVRGVVLRACDVDPDFTGVAASRLRAQSYGHGISVEGWTQDFLQDASTLSDATHVVLNPPFIPIEVSTSWATGKVNAAALFVLHALRNMSKGSKLLAVLPDVLRSGSRYRAWRGELQRVAMLTRIEIGDVFDKDTDVHVFMLEATVGGEGESVPWFLEDTAGRTLGDLFDVRVGPVVPHRDEESGVMVEYVTAKSLSAGETWKRRFSGRLETGPLVLVNRTSRPGEVPRVRARIHHGEEGIAVENHLLVLVPKDGTLASCEQSLKILQAPPTADFLDSRIRCRHLTVGSLKEVPWPT